ncbi:MAG: NUDIX domain-containing protein [Caulobacteraceae bacterium]
MVPPVSIKGVLLVEGKVVLLKNSRDEWELPGGRVDPGESHEQTLSAGQRRAHGALPVARGAPVRDQSSRGLSAFRAAVVRKHVAS